jgi:hypothetical protein
MEVVDTVVFLLQHHLSLSNEDHRPFLPLRTDTKLVHPWMHHLISTDIPVWTRALIDRIMSPQDNTRENSVQVEWDPTHHQHLVHPSPTLQVVDEVPPPIPTLNTVPLPTSNQSWIKVPPSRPAQTTITCNLLLSNQSDLLNQISLLSHETMPRHILLPVNHYQEVLNDGTTTEITHDHLILQNIVHPILESMNIVVPHRTVLKNVVHHLHNPPNLMIRPLVLDPHKSVLARRLNPPTSLSQWNVNPPSVVEDRGWMLIPLRAINLIDRLHMVKSTRRCRSRRIDGLKWRLLLEQWRWMRIMIRRMISRKKSETS